MSLLPIPMETICPNNGWKMSIMETIGTIHIGENRYQGRTGISSGIGTLENSLGSLSGSISFRIGSCFLDLNI
jgi:hypothetical protein